MRRRLSLRMDYRTIGQSLRLFRSHGSLSSGSGTTFPPTTATTLSPAPPTAELLDVCPSPHTLSPQSLSPSSPDRLNMLRSESPTEGYGRFKQVSSRIFTTHFFIHLCGFFKGDKREIF